MTFVLYAAGIVLVGLIAVLVAWPLLAAQTESVQPLPATEHIVRWEKQKAAAYAAIREAEFDKQMGKLTDEDYQFIRQKYEARAIEALTQLDQLNESMESVESMESIGSMESVESRPKGPK